LLFAFCGFGLLDFCFAFCFGGLFAFEYWEEAFTLGLWCGKLLEGKRMIERKNC
jgi:hypothetical protein